MLKKERKILLVTLVIIIACFVNFNSFAGNYPEKNVEVIVGFDAGGSTDIMMRMICSGLEQKLGKRFLVVNIPGAGGEIGWTTLFSAKADGYTLSNVNLPGFLTTYSTNPDCKYVLEDFTLLASFVTDPGVLAVSSNSPFKTLEEYIDYAKENPSILTCSRESTWGNTHIALNTIEREAGIKLTGVQFDGNAGSRAALLGGHISSLVGKVSEVYSLVEAGKMRCLAIMSEKRSADMPDVPTFQEKGYNVINNSSRGIMAPKGIPEEVRNILINTLTEIVNDPDFIQKMEQQKLYIDFISGEEYYKSAKAMEKDIIQTIEEVLEIN